MAPIMQSDYHCLLPGHALCFSYDEDESTAQAMASYAFVSLLVAYIIAVLAKYTAGAGTSKWRAYALGSTCVILVCVQYSYVIQACAHLPNSWSASTMRYDCMDSSKGGKITKSQEKTWCASMPFALVIFPRPAPCAPAVRTLPPSPPLPPPPNHCSRSRV